MLVRAEAEAANQAAKRSTTPSTPIEEYGHMPVPVREGMKAVTGWCLNARVHAEFIKFCRCVGNQRAQTTAALFRTSPDTTFPRYFGKLGKPKGLEQLKSRALAVHVPSEAVLPCRSINDIGRLMALMFLVSASRGLEITADMKTREEYVSQDLLTYLAIAEA